MIIDKELEKVDALSQKIDIIKHCLWPRKIKSRIATIKIGTIKRWLLAGHKKRRSHKQKSQ